MTRSRKSSCAIALMLWLLGTVMYGADKLPAEYDMNANWAFHRGEVEGGHRPELDVTSWMPAALPHIMQLERKHCGGDIIYNGVGWYRRTFSMPEEHRGKRVVIRFEGVMNACTVYLNGDSLHQHYGGYVGFSLDLSKHLKYGGAENVLAVRVSAEYDPLTPPGKPQERMDFYYYSGIYRDVSLRLTDPLHITDELEEDVVAGGGIFVTYPQVSAERATVAVKTHLRNSGSAGRKAALELTLRSDKGKAVARARKEVSLAAGAAVEVPLEMEVEQPRLWFPDTPNLYTLTCEVKEDGKPVDREERKVGIRRIHYTRDGGFFINGKHLYLIGANRHQAYPHIGDAASNSMQERDVIDMKRGGYNAVRAAHYPQDPAFLEACDRWGLLVVECIPGWQYFNHDPIFSDRLEDVCRRMIRRDRNHPSVVLWETALNETGYPLEVVRRIYETAHSEYPGDQFYAAGDYFGHEDLEPYYDVFYKQVSRWPKDGNVMSNYLEDQAAVKPLFTREWGDGVGSKPRVSIAEDEREQLKQCMQRMDNLCGNGYFDWCMLDANPRMGGHFMWSYNDYNRGSEEETMFSGVVDVNRWPKFSYYMMQSRQPLEREQKGAFGGPMIYIASFNTSADFESSTSGITVFSNCDEVRLYRNGTLIGTQTKAERAPLFQPIVDKGGSPAYVFDAGTYQAGTLLAEGYVNGKKVAQHTVSTPGEAHHIEVFTLDYPIRPIADGSDMIPVYFKICDREGTLVNSSDAEIHITVQGAGSLIGGGIERLGISHQRVEGGIGFAFIRTAQKAGKITVSAEAEGIEGGSLTLKTYATKRETLPGGYGSELRGHEEDGVQVRANREEREILARKQIAIKKVETTSAHSNYPTSNITDGDDFSWWTANSDIFPQTITLELAQETEIYASRIRFQKDSSSYTHRVEYSTDGTTWHSAYEKTCTGWEFKPTRIGQKAKYFRLTINEVSEGRAGLAEITLFE